MTEAAFQKRVIEYAMRCGWWVAHFPRANPEGRWRTPVSANAKGYVDCTLVRGPALIFAELKAEKGRLRPEQKVWIEKLMATGNEVYVWRPSDWPEIERRLSRRG